MNDDMKHRLESIVAAKQAAIEATDLRRREQEESKARLAAKEAAASAKWPKVRSLIGELISELNRSIASVDIELRQSSGAADAFRLEQHFIEVWESGQRTNKQLVLNVDTTGYTNVVFLTPHTGRASSNFEIQEADRDLLEEILVRFLEQLTQSKA